MYIDLSYLLSIVTTNRMYDAATHLLLFVKPHLANVHAGSLFQIGKRSVDNIDSSSLATYTLLVHVHMTFITHTPY